MKKLTAVFITAVILITVALSTNVLAAEEFNYAHIVAGGNDPYATFTFSPGGNHTTIDPDAVRWATIKYRTVTETDSTGVQLIGQLYISPAVEPFIPVKYEHTKKWETIVVDLTSVSEKTELASKWNKENYTDISSIRFDPLESDRDAEAQDTANDKARVQDGDSIDIAFIAFFENEEDARAYDGSQDTPYCIITPDDLTWYQGANAISEVEVIEGKKPRPTENTTKEQTTPDESTDDTAGSTDESAVNGEESVYEESSENSSAEVSKKEAQPGEKQVKALPLWATILIAIAAVVLVAAIIAVLSGKTKSTDKTK